MKKFWVRILLALLITVAAAVYQRITGPTYPVSGSTEIDGSMVRFKLLRSHGGEGDQPVTVTAPDTTVQAVMFFKRLNSEDPWKGMKLKRDGENLAGFLPHQPPAGKIEYFVLVRKDGHEKVIPDDSIIVTRFKGAVPIWVLIPHILFMFSAMFLSTLAGLEAITGGPALKKLTIQTAVVLFIGGMILGPIVQKFAFNEFWTGIPYGIDLTDNKTLIAMLGWLVALWAVLKEKNARAWAVIAAAVLLLVYSIPHSVMGSELDYKTGRIQSSR